MRYNPRTLFHKTERITLTSSKTRTIRNATHFITLYKLISISIVITDLMQIWRQSQICTAFCNLRNAFTRDCLNH